MTPHLAAVLNTGKPAESPSNELVDLALMVMDSSWVAKEYVPAKRAAKLVLKLHPENVEALSKLGRIALLERRFDVAAECFSRAVDVVGTRDPATAVNMAIAASLQKNSPLALSWCELAISFHPEFLPAHIHKAAILEERGDLEWAEATVLDALKIFPGNPELLYALSLYQLMCGDYEHGWANYEHRPPRLALAEKLDEYPEWQGEPLEGKTILVSGEQGIGDRIMFARYIPLLVELGANVVLFTMPEIARLFAESFPEVRILTSDAEIGNLEPDYWLSLGSLPMRWNQIEGVDVVQMPQRGSAGWPYLWAARGEIERFSGLIPNNGRLKVGLCWKGNPKHRRDEYRSIPFAELKPLLEVSGVAFYSLQKGDTESGLVNLTHYCHDMADTAAAIANLDLVITVDTAILHLAGAMGKPVWGLMYTPGDWRWGMHDTKPWYRSAVLFKQAEQLKWGNVVAAVKQFLGKAAQRSGAVPGNRLPESTTGTTFTRPCKYGTMTWLANDHYIGRALDLYGEYSESEAELLRKVLKPGGVVVEAGANVGGLTLAMADMLGKSGRIHAFEPQPAYAHCLRKNAMHAPILAYLAALGSNEGTITLRKVEEQKVHAPGWPSTGEEFEVALYTIDGLQLDECDLIKVDVDGPEHLILKGAEATIDRCRPLIYVEYDKPEEYPDMLPWLHDKGYRLYRHAAPLFNRENFRGNPVNVFGSLISLMVLAVPNERKDLHPCDWGLERIPVEG